MLCSTIWHGFSLRRRQQKHRKTQKKRGARWHHVTHSGRSKRTATGHNKRRVCCITFFFCLSHLESHAAVHLSASLYIYSIYFCCTVYAIRRCPSGIQVQLQQCQPQKTPAESFIRSVEHQLILYNIYNTLMHRWSVMCPLFVRRQTLQKKNVDVPWRRLNETRNANRSR